MKPCKKRHQRFFSHLRNVMHTIPNVASLRSLCVLCCAVAFSFLFSRPAQAQLQQREPVLWRAGVFGNYGFNFHQALFDSLSGLVNSSPSFTGGRGMGFTLGVLFEKPLSHDFSLAGRASVTRLDGSMTSIEPFPQFEPVSAQLIEAELESRFSATITVFSLEPLAAWHPFPNASLYLGGRIGFSAGSFIQDQSIVNDPTGLARLPNAQTSSILMIFPASFFRNSAPSPDSAMPFHWTWMKQFFLRPKSGTPTISRRLSVIFPKIKHGRLAVSAADSAYAIRPKQRVGTCLRR
jgi:hypothetical protein